MLQSCNKVLVKVWTSMIQELFDAVEAGMLE